MVIHADESKKPQKRALQHAKSMIYSLCSAVVGATISRSPHVVKPQQTAARHTTTWPKSTNQRRQNPKILKSKG